MRYHGHAKKGAYDAVMLCISADRKQHRLVESSGCFSQVSGRVQPKNLPSA